MNENIKLKGKELFYLIIATLPPLLLLFIPNYAAIYVGIDSWSIFVLIAVIDVLFNFIAVRMGMLEPDKTVIGMSRYAFGNIVGTLFGMLFVLLFAFKSLMFFRQSLEYAFMSTYTLEPIYYFAVPMIMVLIYGQFCRTKTIARINNIAFWLMVAAYFFIMLSAVRNFEIKNFMPAFADGVSPILNALPHFFTWSGNGVILLMLFKRTEMKKGVTKYVTSAAAIAYAIVIVLNIVFIGVFGVISGFITSSVLELTMFLNSRVFFNNFDSIIRLIWIFSTFSRDCIFISCTVDALSELIKLRDKKVIRVVLPVLLTVPSIIWFGNEEMYFMTAMGISSYLCAAVQYGCVLLLYIGIKIKHKEEQRVGSGKAVTVK